MGIKQRRQGLLRRPHTITGEKTRPKSLKPKEARRLIRRFHVLQKNRHSVIIKLNELLTIPGDKLSPDTYKKQIKNHSPLLFANYETKYNSYKVPSKYADNDLIRIDEQLTTEMLITKLAEIDSESDKRGGIEAYQSASTQGQNSKRGGDSLKKLVEWLKDGDYSYSTKLDQELNALEIGCLSPSNIISTSGIFKEVVKIDLNSQNHLILEQDFMMRPLPKTSREKFNLVSCSLVLNFVPSPKERGDMLKRITQFLKPPKSSGSVSSLFLVLPLPCIENSRYFNNEILNKIMSKLGFRKTCYYAAKKVAYWLFDWEGKLKRGERITKREVAAGANKNNFCITLD